MSSCSFLLAFVHPGLLSEARVPKYSAWSTALTQSKSWVSMRCICPSITWYMVCVCKQLLPFLTVCHSWNFCLHSGVLSDVLIPNLSPLWRPEINAFLFSICACCGGLSYGNFLLRQWVETFKLHSLSPDSHGIHLLLNLNIETVQSLKDTLLWNVLAFLGHLHVAGKYGMRPPAIIGATAGGPAG